MLTVRLFCLASLGFANEACLDASSLFQEPSVHISKPKAPLAGLLASAKGMLIHGTTTGTVLDDLVAVLDGQWSEVNASLLEQAKVDQAFLASNLNKFDTIIDDFQALIVSFSTKQDQVNEAISYHSACRLESEKTACTDKQTCEGQLYSDMCNFIEAETQFLSTSQTLDGILCGDQNVSDSGVQGRLVEAATPFAEDAEAAINAKQTYDVQKGLCDTAHEALAVASNECNSRQTAMESASCTLVQDIKLAVSELHATWQRHHASYQGITEMISKQEYDRRQEYVSLIAMKCILGRISELNGKPCDSSDLAGGSEDTVCEQEAKASEETLCTNETTKDLCFDFQAPPADPVTPSVADYPCTEDWITNHMPPPDFPVAPFSHENIGCNAWPACGPCALIADPDTNFTRWVKPVQSDNANHTEAWKHATEHGYINEVGSVNFDDAGNPIENDSGYSADLVNADYEDSADSANSDAGPGPGPGPGPYEGE